MSIYVCRWPNGDFSVVAAASIEDAIVRLDEVGNAEKADLFPLRKFMVNFKLRKKVEDLAETIPVELEDFAEMTEEFLITHVYPVYTKTLFEVTEGLPDGEVSDQEYQEALSQVANSLEAERKRREGAKKPDLSEDPVVRHCQELTDMPRVLVERLMNNASQTSDVFSTS